MYLLTLLDHGDEERMKILQDAFDNVAITHSDHYQPGYEGVPLAGTLITYYTTAVCSPLAFIDTATQCDRTFRSTYIMQ